jgi:hypothetical protein
VAQFVQSIAQLQTKHLMETKLHRDAILSNETEIDPLTKVLESAPEDERWDPIGGSESKRAIANVGDDQDEEGRSGAERLFAEGIDAAEIEQIELSEDREPS